MTIRDAAALDLPAILDIYNDAVLNTTATADYEPRTLAERETWFSERAERGFPVIVAADESGRILGWGSLNPYHGRVGYRFTAENSVYVAADARGKGVGGLLLGDLVARAEALGLHAVVASIDGDNRASIRLHERFGFEHCGRIPQIVRKFDRWLDVVYMARIFCEQVGGQGQNDNDEIERGLGHPARSA